MPPPYPTRLPTLEELLYARSLQEQQQKQAAAQQSQQTTSASGLGGLAGLAAVKKGYDALFPATTTAVGELAAPGTLGTGIPGLIGGSALNAGEVGLPGLQGGPALVNGGAEAGVGTLGTVAGGLAALHGGYNLLQNYGKGDWKSGAISGAEVGAGLGTIIPGAGTLAGAGIGAVAGGLLGAIKTGKHQDQIARDQVRSEMQKRGMIDEGFNLTLADGSKFNIGLDGGAKPEYSGGQAAYNVKTSSPFAVQAVRWVDPVSDILTGFDKKLSTDFAGYFANAAMSNAQTIEGVRANALKLLEQTGLDRAKLEDGIRQGLQAGKIDQGTFGYYMQSIDSLFSGKDVYVGGWQEYIDRNQPTQPVAQPAAQATTSPSEPVPANPVPRVPMKVSNPKLTKWTNQSGNRVGV